MKIVIVGLGTIGKTVLRSLSNMGHTIVIIDENKDKVENMIEKYDVTGVVGNGACMDILKEAGIKTLVEDEIPVFDGMTQWVMEYYENTDDAIIKHWRVEDIPSMGEVVEDEQITNS